MNHEIYIQRCLELAEKGKGHVAPNPMVGCVIVKDYQIIGEGYHQKYGGPHAEVNAVNSVLKKDTIKGSTVYVSLEPCAHQGLTPPCSDLLIKHQVAEVIVCNKDPYHQVDGAGFEKLINAGIKIHSGILENEGFKLNKRFFTFHIKKRPYIILKWAQTQDGFIAPLEKNDHKVFWISGKKSQQLVHQWRSEESAILVGKSTVMADNPNLNVRHVKGLNPVRIILDSNLELERDQNIYNSEAETIVFNKVKSEVLENINFVASDMSLKDILEKLHKLNHLSILVEGGLTVLNAFIEADLWDEARQFIGTEHLHSGIQSPDINKPVFSSEMVGMDKLNIYFND